MIATTNTVPGRQAYLCALVLTIICVFSLAEICSICSNETHIMHDESARVVWPPGNTDVSGLQCSDIANKTVDGFFSNCTIIHSYSDIICKCGPIEQPTFTCPLCGDGVELPEPGRVVTGKTCEQWQDQATNQAFAMDCPYYQKSVGAYCGCDISQPDFFEGYCRLCNNMILPDFDKQVAYVDGSKRYCLDVEIDVNIYSFRYNCTSEQNKYNKACGCDTVGPELPTLSPTDQLSAGNQMHFSTITVILAASFLWCINAIV